MWSFEPDYWNLYEYWFAIEYIIEYFSKFYLPPLKSIHFRAPLYQCIAFSHIIRYFVNIVCSPLGLTLWKPNDLPLVDHLLRPIMRAIMAKFPCHSLHKAFFSQQSREIRSQISSLSATRHYLSGSRSFDLSIGGAQHFRPGPKAGAHLRCVIIIAKRTVACNLPGWNATAGPSAHDDGAQYN